jgi:hypothetical protein
VDVGDGDGADGGHDCGERRDDSFGDGRHCA